jgi:hypothetical protein
MTDQEGPERKRETSRERAKLVKDNADWRKRTGSAAQTPGVAIRGYEFQDDSSTESPKRTSLEEEVVAYVLRRGGFRTNPEDTVDTLSRMRDSTDVADVFIARILGPDEQYGLKRKFYLRKGRPIHAHTLEDGAVVEYGVESYTGFISRTYYVVRGDVFVPLAQHNFRKTD